MASMKQLGENEFVLKKKEVFEIDLEYLKDKYKEIEKCIDSVHFEKESADNNIKMFSVAIALRKLINELEK